jgi:hypothetical protein
MGIIAAGRKQTPLVKREIERGDALARRIAAGDPQAAPPPRPKRPGTDGPLPKVLAGRSRRAPECLLFLAQNPDSSNRETATAIGVAHGPQISKVLKSLADDNLAAKSSDGIGRRNAWRLTSRGEELLPALANR